MPRAVIIACFNYLQIYLREKSLKVFITFVSVTFSMICIGQEVDGEFEKNRRNRRISLGAAAGLTVGSYSVLSSVWYEDFNKEKFHFFKDMFQM